MFRQFLATRAPEDRERIGRLAALVPEPEALFVYTPDEFVAMARAVRGDVLEPEDVRQDIGEYCRFVAAAAGTGRTALEQLRAVGRVRSDAQEPHVVSYGHVRFDERLPSLCSRGITEIVGEAGVGKTQWCMQLLVTAQLTSSGAVVYLSTKPFAAIEVVAAGLTPSASRRLRRSSATSWRRRA